MSLSKLQHVFSGLSVRERRQLVRDAETGGFSANLDEVKLLIHLEELSVANELSTYSREAAMNTLFSAFEGDDQRMRLLESGLLRRIENYLVELELRLDPPQRTLLAATAYNRRNLPKAFRYEADQLQKSMEGAVDPDGLLLRYELARLRLQHDSRNQSRKQPLDFNRVVESLDAWYVAAKLKHACEVINARNVLAVDAELRLMEEVRLLAATPPFADEPAVAAYRMVYDSLTNPEHEEIIGHLQQFMREKGWKFPFEEQRELFQYMKNFCIKKLNTGKTEYTQQLFDIYKLTLDNVALLEDEPLSPFEFKNMVTIALRIGEFAWVEKFIPSHLKYLLPEHRVNAETYTMGNYHFFRKDYKSTLRLFQQVEFTDVFYALDVRSILLKIYFEQQDEDLFFYQASSFRTFLSRHKQVSAYQRTIYKNFIRFAALLLKADGETQKLAAIARELEEVKQVADIRWLREKCNG
jgi:hypothetical protein